MAADGMTGREQVADLAIVGAGPAGCALAAAAARLGLGVALVDPDPEKVWPQTYGVWADELAARGLERCAAARWERTEVVVGGSRGALDLDRAYCLVDNAALGAALRGTVSEAGGRLASGAVTGLRSAGGVVHLAGVDLVARAVVDATGSGRLLAPRAGPPPAVQVAYGVRGRASRPLGTPGAMMLMDWRPASGSADPLVPSFLYAMDLGEGWWFAEETSLAARPAVEPALLRERLEDRLQGLGAQLTDRWEPEVVRIPMGGALPVAGQPVAAFGAAGGMVHPATGYSVGAALRRAPEVAEAAAEALASTAATPSSVADAIWAACWSASRRQEHALHSYGLEAVLTMDQAGLSAFFAAFFAQPREWWRGYLAAELGPGATAAGMGRLMANAPRRVRPALVRPLLGRGGNDLARGLLRR